MKNIENAIKAEQEYVNLTLMGEQVNFMDFLSKFGYSNFKDFLNDKNDYKLKSLKWDVICQPKIDLIVTNKNIALQKPAFMYSIYTGETYAFVKTDYPYKEHLSEMGYKTIPMGYNSENGVILSFDGDLRIYLIVPNNIDVDDITFLLKLKNHFVSLGLNAVVKDNDILIDDKKVCGSGMFSINVMLNIVYQINFTDHIEEIEKICGKGRKRPGFIPNDIITPEELKDVFVSWIKF